MIECIFCGNDPDPKSGSHHILPRAVLNKIDYPLKKENGILTARRVPMCRPCHVTFHQLQDPLIKIIRYLKNGDPIPTEFAYMVDEIYHNLVRARA